jgi:hypothetical protein
VQWRCFFTTVLVLLLILSVAGAAAHVPITPANNEALATATQIVNPLKSWAIYGELHAGGVANYYRVELAEGERLRLLLFVPAESAFTPSLVLVGPGINPQGVLPAFVQVPVGLGARVFAGERAAQASYEPFTPASQYELLDLDLVVNTSGTYYLAVYDASQGGPYGLAVGYREEFSLVEWIRVPFDVINVHRWAGQSLGFILAPLIGILVFGFALLLGRRRKGSLAPQGLFGWLGSAAGLLYIGSGAMVLMQMGVALSRAPVTPAVIVTLIFALMPLIAGAAVLRTALRAHGKLVLRARATMASLGILGFFIWAGLVVGPVLALLTGIFAPRGT